MHQMIEDASYMAHGYCLLWKPWLVTLHAGSDFLIFAAYFAIPVAIWIFVRKRPTLPLQNLAWLFAAFILLCGLTHIINLVTLWWPIYEVQGWVKLATALVSVATALAVFPLIPKALAIPTPDDLVAANQRLTSEVLSHLETLRELEAAKQSLQTRVADQEQELSRAQAILAAVSETTPTFIYAKDNQGALVFVNSAVLKSLGRTADQVIGKTDADFLVDRAQAETIMANDKRIRETKTSETLEEKIETPDGKNRTFVSTKTPHLDAAGKTIGLIGVSIDITERKQLEADLAASEERLRLGSEAARFVTYEFDPATGAIAWSDRFQKLFGEDLDEETGAQTFLSHVHPEDRHKVPMFLGDRLSVGTRYEQEYRVVLNSGGIRWLLDRCAMRASVDGVGSVARITGAVADITDRKLAEQRLALLMNEVTHRGKNQIAVIQSIANRSLTGDRTLEEAREIFQNRLLAISRSMSNLGANRVQSAELKHIVTAELETVEDRVDISGPPIPLQSRAAQNFSLLIHELATNAVKYGALSVPGGRVSVSWRLNGTNLRFDWLERGGPPASPPTRKGFGTVIIAHNVATEFKTKVDIDYGPDGLTYGFDAALALIEAEAD
jgi:PAS domain S-box-containing protein